MDHSNSNHQQPQHKQQHRGSLFVRRGSYNSWMTSSTSNASTISGAGGGAGSGTNTPPRRPHHKRARSTDSGGAKGGNSFSNLFGKTLNPAHHMRNRIVKKAAGVVDKYVTDLTNKSPYLLSCDCTPAFTEVGDNEQEEPTQEETTPPTIPLFDRSEIQVGKLLGDGGFCRVYGISNIHLRQETSAAANEDVKKVRLALAKEVTSSSTTTLAVKQLRKRLTKNPPQFTLALADLVMEAQYLSRLCHPHIVPVRGMTNGGIKGSMLMNGTTSIAPPARFDSYFLIMDKLETTLDKRIRCWQRGIQDNPSYDQKLTWALQIAQALEYLHQRRILFRDVKPQNIGFRADTGQLQLFDFGLCRELPAPRERPIVVEDVAQQQQHEYFVEGDVDDDGVLLEGEEGEEEEEEGNFEEEELVVQEEEEDDEDEDLDDYYLMTKVGTRRYCAVEMYISGRYNEKIDVYSWAMTVYEMISLCKPFASLTDADHQEYVCAQGKRPNTKPFLQQCEQTSRGQRNPLLALIREAWEQYVRYRIDMTMVVEQMEDIIEDRRLQREDPNRDHHNSISNTNSAALGGSSCRSFTSDKERQVEGSVVSVTTATVCESDHEDIIDSPLHHHSGNISNSLANAAFGSPVSSPSPLYNSNNREGSEGEEEEDTKKDNEKAPDEAEDEEDVVEDDAGSVHSLLVVDIGIQSRHSIVSSSPSLETPSVSDQASSLWGDDSTRSSETGFLTEGASLSAVAFDEYLKPRHRGCAVESASLAQQEQQPRSPPLLNRYTSSPKSSPTHATTPTSAATAAAEAAGLAPPTLAEPSSNGNSSSGNNLDNSSINRIIPPTTMLSRIVSMELQDEEESDEDDEEAEALFLKKALGRDEQSLMAAAEP